MHRSAALKLLVKLPETDKDQLVEAPAAHGFLQETVSTSLDVKMADPLKWRSMSRFGVADEVIIDLVDHYATLSVYLRLNSLVPPTSQKKP